MFAKKFQALTFDDQKLVLVRLEKHTGTYVVKEIVNWDLPAGLVDDFFINDPQKFAAFLKEKIKGNVKKLDGQHLFIGIPEEKSYLKVFKPSMPNIEEEVLKIAKVEFPLTRDDGLFFWSKIGDKVQTLAVEKRLLENWQLAFNSLKVGVSNFYPIPQAIARLIIESKAPILALVGQDSKLRYLVTQKDLVYFSKSADFDQTITAETLKVIEEIKKIFKFLKNDPKIGEIGRILLFGQIQPAVKDNLFSTFGLPVENWVLPLENQTQADWTKFTEAVCLAIVATNNPVQFQQVISQDSSLKGGRTVAKKVQAKKEESLAALIFFILAMTILGYVILGLYGPFQLPFFNQGGKVKKTPPPQVTIQKTPKPALEATKTAQASPTAKILDRSVLKIKILNGSGRAGVATDAGDYLKEKGWQIVEVGNADRQNYPKTQIQFKKDFGEFEEILKADLANRYQIEKGPDLDDKEGVDIVVIIGLQ